MQELPLLEGRVCIPGDDDVIENIDADDPSSLEEPPGDGEVLFAGRRIARGMVMGKNQRGSRDGDRWLEYLPRMDDRGIEASDRDDLPTKDHVPTVEVEGHEVLAVGRADIPAE